MSVGLICTAKHIGAKEKPEMTEAGKCNPNVMGTISHTFFPMS
jgi:hypothetical protein